MNTPSTPPVENRIKNSQWSPKKIAIAIATAVSLLGAGGGGTFAFTSGDNDRCPEKCSEKIEKVREAVIANGKAISHIAGYLGVPEK